MVYPPIPTPTPLEILVLKCICTIHWHLRSPSLRISSDLALGREYGYFPELYIFSVLPFLKLDEPSCFVISYQVFYIFLYFNSTCRQLADLHKDNASKDSAVQVGDS